MSEKQRPSYEKIESTDSEKKIHVEKNGSIVEENPLVAAVCIKKKFCFKSFLFNKFFFLGC